MKLPSERACVRAEFTMADLDDFFAKKDKKKGKAKKFVTAEEIAKQLDDTSKKAVESKMKKAEPADNKLAADEVCGAAARGVPGSPGPTAPWVRVWTSAY